MQSARIIKPEGWDYFPVAGHIRFSKRVFGEKDSYLDEGTRTAIFLYYQGLSYAGAVAAGYICASEAVQRIL